MKKILLTFSLFFLFLNLAFWASGEIEILDCKYSEKIKQCLSSQDSYRTIENFVCIKWSTESIAYQIVLDDKFKEIDEEAEAYLAALEDAKDYYFWPNKKEDYTNAVNEIESFFWEKSYFANKYKNLCWWEILAETIDCLWWKSLNIKAKDFLTREWWDCVNLYITKLSFYKDVAYNILKLNKQQVLKDNHKLFTQQQRTKYDNLLDIIRINIWYIERIWKKWPSKTESPL